MFMSCFFRYTQINCVDTNITILETLVVMSVWRGDGLSLLCRNPATRAARTRVNYSCSAHHPLPSPPDPGTADTRLGAGLRRSNVLFVPKLNIITVFGM